MMQRITINIKAQEQVGAIQYYQIPSSKALEKLQLVFGDEYEQRSYVMDAKDAGELLNQFAGLNGASLLVNGASINIGEKPNYCQQITLTTIEGGLIRADIKQTALISNASYDSPEKLPAGNADPYLDGEGAGGDGEENRENAKTITHSFSYKSVNIATHPELESVYNANGDKKTAVGIIANGGDINTEFRSEQSAGSYVAITTPAETLKGDTAGDMDLIELLQKYSTYDVKIINISYKYSGSKAPKIAQKIGEEVPITSLPKNGLGAMFGKLGKAYLTNVLCEWQGKGFCDITEQYQIEIVPTLKELIDSKK